jgi:hypothetical protein
LNKVLDGRKTTITSLEVLPQMQHLNLTMRKHWTIQASDEMVLQTITWHFAAYLLSQYPGDSGRMILNSRPAWATYQFEMSMGSIGDPVNIMKHKERLMKCSRVRETKETTKCHV